jgi:hypothetical protein
MVFEFYGLTIAALAAHDLEQSEQGRFAIGSSGHQRMNARAVSGTVRTGWRLRVGDVLISVVVALGVHGRSGACPHGGNSGDGIRAGLCFRWSSSPVGGQRGPLPVEGLLSGLGQMRRTYDGASRSGSPGNACQRDAVVTRRTFYTGWKA